jgi:hypothetical protein
MRALGASVLYLLALNAVACARVAWGETSALGLMGWAVGLGVALGIGERLGDSFAVIEAKRRDRVAVFLGTVQFSVLALALLLAALRPTPGLLGFLADVLSGYQLLVLALARLAPQPRGVVGHSLALAALACLRGGPLAAWAAGSTLGLMGLYVGIEHHARLLAAHRLDDGGHAGRALWLSAVMVLPVALATGLAIGYASPDARPDPQVEIVDDSYRPIEEAPKRELDARSLRTIVITGLVGAVGVYFVGRWMVRSKGGETKSLETPEPLRGTLERIQPERGAARAPTQYPGQRGRIVRAYLDLLRGAGQSGFPRRLDETPAEFSRALGEPREPLAATTEAFERARYGPFEPTGAEAEQAEHGVATVLERLRLRPPRRRDAVVTDVGGPRGIVR